jgi:hypothetical protein
MRITAFLVLAAQSSKIPKNKFTYLPHKSYPWGFSTKTLNTKPSPLKYKKTLAPPIQLINHFSKTEATPSSEKNNQRQNKSQIHLI